MLFADVTGDLCKSCFAQSADVETLWEVLWRGLGKQLSVTLSMGLETKTSKLCGLRVDFGNYRAPVLRKSKRGLRQ